MSSPDEDEGSVCGARSDPEGGEQAGPLGPILGKALLSSQSQGWFPDPEGSEDWREVMEGRGEVLWGCEGRPCSPADLQGDTLVGLGQEAAMAILQQLTGRDDLGLRRYPSPESCGSEVSTLEGDVEPGPRGRVLSAHASAARMYLRGPCRGQAWGNPKRGAKNRAKVRVGRQQSSAEVLPGARSDSESSDDVSEMQAMRAGLCGQGEGQAKPRSPQNAPRRSGAQVRETFLRVPGSFLPSAPSGGRRQAVGELGAPSKEPQSVVGGKAGSRPSSLPGAAADAAGGLPKVAPGRKVAAGEKALAGASKRAPKGTFSSWGQSLLVPPLEAASFPKVSGGLPLVRGKRYSLVPLGTKQSKPPGAGRKSVTRKKRGSLPVIVEDPEPKRDPGPTAQPQANSPGPFCREFNSGDANNRAAQVPGGSQPVVLSQGEVLPRGPTPTSDQEALRQPPTPPERQQEPPGAEGCPRCPELQRQIWDLRQQLVAMQSLADKFRNL